MNSKLAATWIVGRKFNANSKVNATPKLFDSGETDHTMWVFNLNPDSGLHPAPHLLLLHIYKHE